MSDAEPGDVREGGVPITLRLRPDVASTLHLGGSEQGEVRDFLRKLDELGVTLQPVHHAVDHPLLGRYFVVEAPDGPTAAAIVAELRQAPGVESAHEGPPPES